MKQEETLDTLIDYLVNKEKNYSAAKKTLYHHDNYSKFRYWLEVIRQKEKGEEDWQDAT